MSNPDNNPNEMGDLLTTNAVNPEFALIGPPPPLIPNSEVLTDAITSETDKKNTRKTGRRSQRQIG